MANKIAVIGAGQMGAGIAQVAAQSGMEVCIIDPLAESLKNAQAKIPKSLEKLADKKLLTQTPTEIFSRMQFSQDSQFLKSFAPQFVIEAIVEKEDVKKRLFQDLSKILAPDVIYASNTSSISITTLATSVPKPENFIGMHFMNPVPLMKLVEIIPGLQTNDVTLKRTRDLAEKMGKTCVLSKDMPGFIVNRILMPMINEAVFALQEGLGTADDIDQGMKLGTNQPMGPLALADFIGLDTCLYIMNVLFEGLGDSKYRPAPMLKQYVDAGWVGKKSCRGFYKYN